MSWRGWVEGRLAAIREAQRWRQPRDLDARGPAGRLADDREVVSFAGNDYLGLSGHPAVVAAAAEALERWGAGAGAARLVVGSRPVHSALEADLAAWKAAERAVLFPTGYAANLGVLATFGHSGARILSDELNHASIVDGCRLARAEVAVFAHGDLEHLGSLMHGEGPVVVVTDTVFSMDGDVADLEGLGTLCRERGALLVLDEAHAVLGPHTGADGPLEGVEVVRVGTLSKTLGSLGGFVVADAPYAELLVNVARPYIFTTAPAPASAAAARAALSVLRSGEGERLLERLASHVEVIRPGHPSPIVPVVLGDEAAALAASASLLEEGLLVPAIRPPTVPAGTSRLRVALSAAHTDEQVARLCDALAGLEREVPRAPA